MCAKAYVDDFTHFLELASNSQAVNGLISTAGTVTLGLKQPLVSGVLATPAGNNVLCLQVQVELDASPLFGLSLDQDKSIV